MTSFYSVIQYSPDPMAEEKVNIGVIAWDDHGARVKFVKDFRRARSLGTQGVSELRPFATLIEEKTRAVSDLIEGVPLSEFITENLIHWSGVIQLTPPRGSLESPCDLLEKLSPRYIVEPQPSRKRGRDRRNATSEAYSLFVDAVRQVEPNHPSQFVKRQGPVAGKLNNHQFDVVLSDEIVSAAVNTMSFEVGTGVSLQKDVDAIAWAIDDVRAVDAELPLAVYVLRTSLRSEPRRILESAKTTYLGLNAQLLDSRNELRHWTNEQAQRHELRSATDA